MQNWVLVLPPSRPSALQLARIKETIQYLDRSFPVAVLGSTPEFRDLLCEGGFTNIYIMERNENFYKVMSKARIYQNPEHFVKGDWLKTLPQHKGMFAFILSDLTSGNVPYLCRSQFYNSITDSL